MSFIFGLIFLALYLFLVCLILRLIVEWIQAFARQWQAQGFVLRIVSISFLVTDPILRPIRRVIPPVSFGSASVDISLLLLVFVLTFLLRSFGLAG